MFTENEVILMLENKQIEVAVTELKKDFVKNEAKFMEINDHDFLSLVLLSPAVGVALANESVSLFEELALNKKARKLSLGGYFWKKDPVVNAMGHLISHFKSWEEKFFTVLRLVINEILELDSMDFQETGDEEITPNSFRNEVLKAPYGYVRFISSFFCKDDDDLINAEQRNIAQKEFDAVVDIGNKLNLDKVPIFRHFCGTYNMK